MVVPREISTQSTIVLLKILIFNFMKESETIDITTVDKKMNVIIGLLSKMVNSPDQTMKDRIAELASYGLVSTEIGPMVGKTAEAVSKELYKIKSGKK